MRLIDTQNNKRCPNCDRAIPLCQTYCRECSEKLNFKEEVIKNVT
jgi:predicted amidophosphoribosyltransferase